MTRNKLAWGLAAAALLSLAPASAQNAPDIMDSCDVVLAVLGTAQDAGKPQIGNPDDPAWTDPSKRRYATSLAVIDQMNDNRFLFDATPDIREQVQWLDANFPTGTPGQIDGIFLTHAHIGHYLGLAHLGKEAMGASGVKVLASPEMMMFLTENEPWARLWETNPLVKMFPEDYPVCLSVGGEPNACVASFNVPHRDELSDTVGYTIRMNKKVLFIPDIDSWEDWDAEGVRIEDMIADVDIAFLDATFYSGDELPGRDMSQIPHPTMTYSMERFADLPAEEKAKIRFIHMNHSNPAHDPGSEAYQTIIDNGFNVAQQGDVHCLSEK